MERENWGRRIRAFRKLKGYTQKELADLLEVSVSVLGEVERGNRLPTNEMLKRISEILKIDIDELRPDSNDHFAL